MPLSVSIILDSGSFIAPNGGLPYPTCRVGYFQCDSSCPDVRVYADSEEVAVNSHLKLGDRNGTIDVVHVKADGTAHQGVSKSSTIDKYLLRRMDLYGQPVQVDEGKFDCIIQFHFGRFRCSMVKRRYFKEVNPDGTLGTMPRKYLEPIAHDVVADYTLADGDEL